MFKKSSKVMVWALYISLITAGIAAPSVSFAGGKPKVLGKTIGEWSVKWWQWSLAITTASNLMLDQTGANCNVGQKGQVWFLAGVWGGSADPIIRNCTVPKSKYVFFPISNGVWINSLWDDPNNTETVYRENAMAQVLTDNVSATLDGQPIIFNSSTPIIRSQSPVFTATFPTDNVFGADSSGLNGYPIVSDGYWVILPLLQQGQHTLQFTAGQSQNITYNLTIGKP